MTGTLQALSFSPRPARTLPYRRRHAHFPATHVDLLSGHTFYSKPSPLLLRKPYSIPGPIRVANHSDQVNGDGNRAPRVPDSATASNWMRNLSTFASDNFLPLALVGGVLFGLANPSLGCLADRYYVSKLSTFGIFIISGLTLRSDEIGAAAEAWPVGIFGLGSILLFTPFFSRLILQLQLQPQEFVTGLAIFSCMPTTLSSGVALTRLAGGNSALALAMTVISNLLGILIVPFSISMFIANGVGVTVPTKQLLRSLVLTLLVPLIIGKVCRESSKGLAAFVDQNRKLLSMISALLLGLVPWIQVSRSSSLLLMVKPAIFLVAVGMGALLHLILLAFNALAIQGLLAVSGGSKSVFAKRENVTALLLVASQKTLPVMAAVVEQLGGALGESGLLILPCVAAHLNQIIMDSFFVNFWLQNEQSSNQAKVA
ncbi:probable sodium/metabolite cotransporter BASS4, chloroplastic isoform X1 [Actinidia eriantha]|uniref:probable sodium/metabolite cotransporter BASS4, chloroplastic isoform X1 n=1 Tax=Actinidia eriantha TaxID=165200 RepID=UPI002583B364|nr:probable sodium/metabolite cotransporter BASS4, chloroplastic isoform X1 [Actinidia eriantha]